jgi:hypothetical protein
MHIPPQGSTASNSVRASGTAPVARNTVAEFEFLAGKDAFADPWATVELDVEFTDPQGAIKTVPAFWAGGRSWRVRYSSPIEGEHRFRTIVRAGAETGLEGRDGKLEVGGYVGSNPLLLHGGITVAPDRRHLAHADGTPFLWLGDTWWAALTARFRWPDTFKTLADDRAAKGFNVVQVVGGLVPEFGLFSPLMASEGGQPWQDMGRGPINPSFYDVPDEKIDYLVGKGIVPCIFGGWGSWAAVLGREKVMQHWRYLVARYGAYPVVWCLAGEVEAPEPFAPVDGQETNEETAIQAIEDVSPEKMDAQVEIWEDAAALVGEIDPFERIRTVHPCPYLAWSSSGAFKSRDSFELDMLQTGHEGAKSVPRTLDHIHESLAHGDKPVLNGECSYEGIFDSCWQDVQRFLFWSHMLSGTAGHTYGTMAISTFSSREDPYVPASRVSVHHWEEAIDWLGAKHVGVGRRILERIRWWELQPAPQAIAPHAGADDWLAPYAASLPDGSFIFYLPGQGLVTRHWDEVLGLSGTLTLTALEPGTTYRATFVNPRDGAEQAPATFVADGSSRTLTGLVAEAPLVEKPTMEDWVLLVRPVGSVSSTSEAPWGRSE